jgi:hypothetical protein
MVNQVSIFDEINTFILFLVNLILLLSDVKNGLGLIQLILPHIHTYMNIGWIEGAQIESRGINLREKIWWRVWSQVSIKYISFIDRKYKDLKGKLLLALSRQKLHSVFVVSGKHRSEITEEFLSSEI